MVASSMQVLNLRTESEKDPVQAGRVTVEEKKQANIGKFRDRDGSSRTTYAIMSRKMIFGSCVMLAILSGWNRREDAGMLLPYLVLTRS